MDVFQDGYLSKELISTSKTNGWTLYLEQFETELSIYFIFNTFILFWIFAPISEKQCIWWGTDLISTIKNWCNLFILRYLTIFAEDRNDDFWVQCLMCSCWATKNVLGQTSIILFATFFSLLTLISK